MRPQFDPSGTTMGALLCPACGWMYLHHGQVDVYNRGKEDDPMGVHVTVQADRATVRTDLTGTPSARRDGLTIRLECERCDTPLRLKSHGFLLHSSSLRSKLHPVLVGFPPGNRLAGIPASTRSPLATNGSSRSTLLLVRLVQTGSRQIRTLDILHKQCFLLVTRYIKEQSR